MSSWSCQERAVRVRKIRELWLGPRGIHHRRSPDRTLSKRVSSAHKDLIRKETLGVSAGCVRLLSTSALLPTGQPSTRGSSTHLKALDLRNVACPRHIAAQTHNVPGTYFGKMRPVTSSAGAASGANVSPPLRDGYASMASRQFKRAGRRRVTARISRRSSERLVGTSEERLQNGATLSDRM